jgi:hypothetical protein
MARIAGVDLPRRKHVAYALPYLYGVGKVTALQICKKAKLEPTKLVEELTDADVKRIRDVLDAEYKVEGDLRRDVANEHQAPDGPRLLPWLASPQEPARSTDSVPTPTHRTRKGPRQDHRRQEGRLIAPRLH